MENPQNIPIFNADIPTFNADKRKIPTFDFLRDHI